MVEFGVFMYAFLAGYVLMSLQRNARAHRPAPQVVTLVGWGLFSLSSTLAVLLGAVALALVLGLHVPLGEFAAASI